VRLQPTRRPASETMISVILIGIDSSAELSREKGKKKTDPDTTL